MVDLHHYLILSAVLFALGLVGLSVRKNLLIVFMCVEVLLNAVNITFIAFARYLGRMDGHVVVFFVMAVAAAEAAVGLAILVTLFKNKQSVKADDWRVLRG